MANKRITDVDYTSVLNDNDSLFINQGNVLKQVKKGSVILDVAHGGTGATDGETALKNLFASGETILSPYQYGDTLPSTGVKGRIFFKRIKEE